MIMCHYHITRQHATYANVINTSKTFKVTEGEDKTRENVGFYCEKVEGGGYKLDQTPF